MLHLAAAGLLISLERRGLMEVFPLRVRNLWKTWQLRTLVVSSLGLQVALILSGKRRKHTGYIWFRFFVWSTYLLVDTITELWQRRSLELLTQTITSLYIFLIAWPEISALSILTIPMLIVGLIKFGERIAALRSASSEHFRDSLLTPPDPGPNYVKFMEEFTLKKAEGYYVNADVIVESSAPTNSHADTTNDYDTLVILKAYNLFQRFKRLFVDLIFTLSFQDIDESQPFFSAIGPEKAFLVVEVELGFLYDVLYTKASVVYSATGFLLRFLTMLLSSIVLILFPFTLKGHHYKKVDLVITYMLMGGAIMFEIAGLLVLLSSDWTHHWLRKHYVLSYIYRRKLGGQWSASMAQYNLLDVCMEKEQARLTIIQKLLKLNNSLERHKCLTYHSVSPGLKDLIFLHCLEISQHIKDKTGLMTFCSSRGDYTLTIFDHKELDWSATKVEFDQSILLWHIATELCYYCDTDGGEKSSECIESKNISDYILYLLVVCPFMLPVGIGLIRFRDTCAEVSEFFKDKNLSTSNIATVCKMLLCVNTEVLPSQVKGDRSKSVLFDACRLATSLRALDRDPEYKWKIISRMWVEILGYAAIHCRGTQHAQQLRKGGELITHVWLLMAHLGITEQLQFVQLSQGARVNLINAI